MWVLGVYVYLAVFHLIKKIDVNSIYKVNRRIRLILTFKSSASYPSKNFRTLCHNFSIECSFSKMCPFLSFFTSKNISWFTITSPIKDMVMEGKKIVPICLSLILSKYKRSKSLDSWSNHSIELKCYHTKHI